MSNRVEELESQVAELQAAVDGLTEELVETRERLRRLETEHDIEVKRAPERRDPSAEPDEATSEEPISEDSEAAESTSGSDGDAEDSDIIVA